MTSEVTPGALRFNTQLGQAPTSADVEALMKRCQVGVGGRNALDNAHSIMAECYGTLGRQQIEIERLREFLAIWIADGSLQTFEHRDKFRAEAKRLLGPNVMLCGERSESERTQG